MASSEFNYLLSVLVRDASVSQGAGLALVKLLACRSELEHGVPGLSRWLVAVTTAGKYTQ